MSKVEKFPMHCGKWERNFPVFMEFSNIYRWIHKHISIALKLSTSIPFDGDIRSDVGVDGCAMMIIAIEMIIMIFIFPEGNLSMHTN